MTDGQTDGATIAKDIDRTSVALSPDFPTHPLPHPEATRQAILASFTQHATETILDALNAILPRSTYSKEFEGMTR
jgi:hypothetical protein